MIMLRENKMMRAVILLAALHLLERAAWRTQMDFRTPSDLLWVLQAKHAVCGGHACRKRGEMFTSALSGKNSARGS
jgi:hypothetical protein